MSNTCRLFIVYCLFNNYIFQITMSDYVPYYKKGGVYHPLNIIDISTSGEEVEVEMEVVDKVEKVLYFTVLYNTVIYCSVLYYKVQVVGGIIDISTSSDEE